MTESVCAVEVIEPKVPAIPVLFASPHSGRNYPDDFGTIQPMPILRRAEDAYVDDLIRGAADQGVTIVNALFPRAYLDANRDEDDLDPDLIEEGANVVGGEKSKLGIGIIRRVVTPQYPIYDRRLPLTEVEQRIANYYQPYHAAIASAIRRLSIEAGPIVFIDWHSMKSVGNAATPDGPGAERPDMVMGDRFGSSCALGLTEAIEGYLTGAGFSVSVNKPYAGAATLRRYGKPEKGIHALQIEMNRSIYLDEETVELKPEGAAKLTSAIMGLVPILAEWCAANTA